MKTIFVLISNNILIRNILYTDIFRILRKRNFRIVVVISENWIEQCEKEFNYPNVIFEKYKNNNYGLVRKIFSFLIFSLITGDTAYLTARYGKPYGKRSVFYFIMWYLWSHSFGKINFIKKIFRFLEFYCFPDKLYGHFFDKYKPDLVFSTSILHPVDTAFVKEARRRKIKAIGMPKSWDTLDKYFLRVLPDKLIVQNNSIKKILTKEQDVFGGNIDVCGFSQFDIYTRSNIPTSREEFLTKLKLDPKRRVIFFGSGGCYGPNDDIIAEALSEFVNSHEIIYPSSLIIRAHLLKRKTNIGRFNKFENCPNVFIDDYVEKHSNYDVFKKEGMRHLSELLYYSDVTINPASTLTLDAACLNKPVICVAFKNAPKKEYYHNTSYYKRVIATGGVRIANSSEELKELINQYLSKPFLDAGGREKLRNEMCYRVDGQSGERIANFLTNEIKNNANTY